MSPRSTVRFVARISLNDVRERLFIRSALEGEIVAEAARRMTRADKNALAANLKEEASAVGKEDRTTFYLLDVAFHHIFTTSLGMARASDILEGLRVHLERARRLAMSPPGRLRAAFDEHAAIVAAVESGDAAGAREAMKRHLSMTGTLLEIVGQRAAGTFLALS